MNLSPKRDGPITGQAYLSRSQMPSVDWKRHSRSLVEEMVINNVRNNVKNLLMEVSIS